MTVVEDGRAQALVDAARALRPQIESMADEIERERQLPPALVRALTDAGFFRLYVPHAFGGEEVDPITALRVVEELSQADTSVGWCVWNGLPLPWASSRLPDAAMEEIFARDPATITCGSIQPRGRAVIADGGYRVSGRWPLASGCRHGTWLFAHCLVFDGEQPRRQDSGAPITRVMVLPASDCTILDTWYSTGMRGSGSHDFTVDDVFVPAGHSYAAYGEERRQLGPLYDFMGWIFVGLGGIAIGTARAALEAFITLATEKPVAGTGTVQRDRALVQVQVAQAEALLGMAQAYLYETATDAWETQLSGSELTPHQRARFRLAICASVDNAVKATDMMYRAGGSTSVYMPGRLDRCFRDIHTAAQHLVAGLANYEPIGRLLMGLEAGSPTF